MRTDADTTVVSVLWRAHISSLPPMQVYEVRLRKGHRGVDLVSDVLPFGALWYGNRMQPRMQSPT